ncbi:hypothetical protein KIN20_007430 [Parelaphostrongylus tenuis]|uniref:Anaphase-promoting complex subunit 4-like WD40 domain-containing protein n=1 Tax=Parelaphostrongylus tenuis TaxID=148309 RepID=A0AAD5QM14_PARTN|nr:hypothetical protein KIN20_007430 [Parelaphostrongylus tenuis]
MSEQELDLANYLMSQPADSAFNTSNSAPVTPAKSPRSYEREELKRMMRVKSAGNLTDVGEEDRIWCYKKTLAPLPAVGHLNQAKVLYSTCIQPVSAIKKATRHIPQHPERVLDAPDFKDDYYMNVLDWSSCGVVAVALSYTLYLWNADTGEIQLLFELDESNEMNLITGVKWSLDGKFLAVGFKDGSLKLYDPLRPLSSTNGKLELTDDETTSTVSMRCAFMAWSSCFGRLSIGTNHSSRRPCIPTCHWSLGWSRSGSCWFTLVPQIRPS